MVGRLTTGRAKYRDVEPEVQRILAQLAERREELVRLIDEDAAAYQQVATAYGMARASDEERVAREVAIQQALGAAMEPPRHIALAAAEVLRLAGDIAEVGNPSVASDAGCAAVLAEAALRCAGLNVLANVVLLRDEQGGMAAREEMALLEADARPLLDRTLAVVRARMGA
jgi:formiminotetrahydrofolate cyclodeaminase